MYVPDHPADRRREKKVKRKGSEESHVITEEIKEKEIKKRRGKEAAENTTEY